MSLVTLVTLCLHTIIVKCVKKSLISGGCQLLGNDDDVMVPPGSGLPVGNNEICIFKEKCIYSVFILYFVF